MKTVSQRLRRKLFHSFQSDVVYRVVGPGPLAYNHFKTGIAVSSGQQGGRRVGACLMFNLSDISSDPVSF